MNIPHYTSPLVEPTASLSYLNAELYGLDSVLNRFYEGKPEKERQVTECDFARIIELYFKTLKHSIDVGEFHLSYLGKEVWDNVTNLAYYLAKMSRTLYVESHERFGENQQELEKLFVMAVAQCLAPLVYLYLSRFATVYDAGMAEINAELYEASKAKREAKKQKAAEESAKTAAEKGETK